MINLKQELQNYPYIDLNNLAKDAVEIPDNIKNSVILYNKALDNLRANSEDIAIIELKKAIVMNPDFYEAMNLLGICYSYINDYSRASEIFKKVVSVENNGVKALEYLNSITGQNVEAKREPKKKINENNLNVNNKANSVEKQTAPLAKETNHFSFNRKIMYYLASFFAGALIVFIITSSLSTGSKEIKTVSTVDVQKSDPFEDKYNKLNEDFKELETKLKTSNADIDYEKNVIKLMEAENLALSKDFENAADKLVLLKAVNFKDPEKGKFDSICNDVMPKAAWSAFSQGCDLFAQKNYKGALDKLCKIQTYGNEWSYMDVTLYKIGICYKELNDSRNAIKVFQEIKDTYPNSQYAEYAGYRINELTAVP